MDAAWILSPHQLGIPPRSLRVLPVGREGADQAGLLHQAGAHEPSRNAPLELTSSCVLSWDAPSLAGAVTSDGGTVGVPQQVQIRARFPPLGAGAGIVLIREAT